MQKERLISIVKLMFLALALAFLYVLFRSLAGPSNLSNPTNLFDDVVEGQTAVRRVGAVKVWVTRLSTIHANDAIKVAPYVVDPAAGCNSTQTLCVLLAATQRSGIELVYTQSSPTQLGADVPWFGGFVDPSSGEVFDRLGRAYQQTARQRAALEQADVVGG